MFFSKNDIDDFEFSYRINIINSITGIKPANLIGTKSKNGILKIKIFIEGIFLTM